MSIVVVGWLGFLGACEKPESAQWTLNGFFDPSQVGQFREQRRNEIRSALSILEEPLGIQNTEEPTPHDLEPEYGDQRLASGDVINISIFELLNPGETATQQIRVSTSGFETVPVVGRVRVAGLTTRELELELKDRLRQMQILEDAEVQVSLIETRHQQFSIFGSLSRPGTFTLPTPEYRLLNAIAEAGGVPPTIERMYVFRRSGTGGAAGGAPATTMPGAITDNVSFTMSDVPMTSASGPATRAVAKAPVSRPAQAVDEFKILEGEPTQPAAVPRWDPERMEWVIERPTSAEGAPSRAMARLARTTSRTGEEAPIETAEALAQATRIIEIPVKELLDGDPRYNVVIRPFDVIYVPPGTVGEYYLMGNVARAGAYELTGRKLTVKEALAAGGGFGPLAWPSRADLIRRIGKDEEQVIQLDLDAIFAGNAPDFYVKANDIVNVGTTAVAPFLAVLRNAFRLTYGFGFVYDRNFADADAPQVREAAKTRRMQKAQIRGIPVR